MRKFPFTVNIEYAKLNDRRCCKEVSDHTGFHFRRCSCRVKEVIEGIGLCGIHARSVKRAKASSVSQG